MARAWPGKLSNLSLYRSIGNRASGAMENLSGVLSGSAEPGQDCFPWALPSKDSCSLPGTQCEIRSFLGHRLGEDPAGRMGGDLAELQGLV